MGPVPVAGGSLSSHGARKLLEAPAKFRYEVDHPEVRKTKREFDLGHAAHKVVLGAGPDLVLVDRDRWDTKEVKANLAEIRSVGAVPLKRPDFEMVKAMAAALREHKLAGVLLDPGAGMAEQTLAWRDEETGVWRRAMPDWLWHGGRVIVDYKTADSASRAAFIKAVARYGYHQQDAWYRDGVAALEDPAFLFVVQEVAPPYLVAVYDLDDEALRIGRERNRRALERYRDCTESGLWPGYSTDIETIALPRWAERQHDEEYT
jgi:hypothetical protein